MEDPLFRITYEGGDADAHSLDMRLLGISLQGADKITSDGLIILCLQRPPKRGERPNIIVKVKEPLAGSYDIPGLLQDSFWTLSLGLPIAQHVIGEFLSEWWKAVIAKFSGRPDIAEKSLQALADMNRDHLTARNSSEERAHEERMAYIGLLRETLSMQQKSLEQFIAPVGRSSTSARITTGHSAAITVNSDEADTIRELASLTWSKLEELQLKTDGFRFHTSGLYIHNPEREGYLMAKVSDPQFEQSENSYTAAALRRAEIVVLARKGYRSGELVKIDIVDFIKEI
ncbi:hypothetical protein [uncultured Brevundimonas sp.]|uniref:DUF7946 domain-containing protein n=1 Tax=uncultured Brevundimonas sp. TaxID=213418 RepID=UPI0026204BD4|nr:hypothetical protein [uncultured Brevundimonas sp.]